MTATAVADEVAMTRQCTDGDLMTATPVADEVATAISTRAVRP